MNYYCFGLWCALVLRQFCYVFRHACMVGLTVTTWRHFIALFLYSVTWLYTVKSNCTCAFFCWHLALYTTPSNDYVCICRRVKLLWCWDRESACDHTMHVSGWRQKWLCIPWVLTQHPSRLMAFSCRVPSAVRCLRMSQFFLSASSVGAPRPWSPVNH